MSPLFEEPEYRAPPGLDVFEVTLVGPGYGECCLVHLGDSKWLVVDSLIPKGATTSAPLSYLRDIGHDAGGIEYAIASHWDDDHIRGLSQILIASPHARFVTASAFQSRDFFKFAAAYQRPFTEVQSSRVDEILETFRLGRPIDWAANSKTLLAPGAMTFAHGNPVSLSTLSPSNEDQTRFLGWLATEMPKAGETRRVANTATRNQLSVVVHVFVGDAVALLGGDLETSSDGRCGWSAVVADPGRPQAKADVYKVPHHGSSNAHHDEAWKSLVKEDPIAVLAPWMNGGRIRPTRADGARILSLARRAYATSTPPSPKQRLDRAVARTIQEAGILVVPVSTRLGMIRARKKVGDAQSPWTIETFGAAVHMKVYNAHPHTPAN